jgi:hypothetical protein
MVIADVAEGRGGKAPPCIQGIRPLRRPGIGTITPAVRDRS